MLDRILKLIHKKGLTASKFAEEIGVQRSSISHILSGRNKPSLDLVLKILEKYPTINTDWLLTGKGEMVTEPDLFSIDVAKKNTENKDKPSQQQVNDKDDEDKNTTEPAANGNNTGNIEENSRQQIKEPGEPLTDSPPIPYKSANKDKKIERIVLFFTDNTFKTYFPSRN